MGGLNLGRIKLADHGTTSNHIVKDITEEQFKQRINLIANCGAIHNENRCCYIYGGGGKSRRIYKQLRLKKELQLIRQYTYLPSRLQLLKWFFSSQAALVKIKEASIIPEVMITLTEMAMASLYSFDNKYEADLIEASLATKGWEFEPHNIVTKDESFFSYSIDGDNMESKTGICEIVSYGKDCPAEMIDLAWSPL